MIGQDCTEPSSFAIARELEEVTGADIIVTPLNAPLLPATYPLHVRAGALLIQRKLGDDLLNSLGARLYKALARMRECGARPWQCVLMTVGVYLPDARNGGCVVAIPTIHADGHIEWKYSHLTRPSRANMYSAVVSALRHWAWYGGTVVNLPSPELLTPWLQSAEKHLIEKTEMARRGAVMREVWPDGEVRVELAGEGQPLQGLVEVKDWRGIMATFPGVGPVRATALREAIQKAGASDTLLQALIWATDDTTVVPGWGKVTKRKVRDALGVPDGMEIQLAVKEE